MTYDKSYILGIDIGGTHVDIVAIDTNESIIAFHKEPVSEHIENCILRAIKQLLNKGIQAKHCKAIHLGTTLGINSLLELKSLYRVGVLRIAGHHPDLPPAFNWPIEKKKNIIASFETINGGREYNKNLISEFNPSEVHGAIDKLLTQGAESIAIIGVFSPLYSNDEDRVAQIITDAGYGDLPITLSRHVGGLGFIERENNTIINATLKKVFHNHFLDLEPKLKKLDFNGEVLITQNNGTLLSLQQALQFPIKTISSGPTNSLNGACKLAKLRQAIVIDIGGTSTEIGVIEDGFPRYSSSGATIAGIPTNFMLPSLEVLALGGGSIIRRQNNSYVIGPDSVGSQLYGESQSFHGNQLTLFDVGNVLLNQIPENGILPSLSKTEATRIMKQVIEQLQNKVNDIFIDDKVVILFVGGGSQNIPDEYLNEIHQRPLHYQVANAYGAALAEVCGTVDAIHQLGEDRQGVIDKLEQEAINQALANGAEIKSIRIIEKRLLPFYYMDNQLTRVIITAAGKKLLIDE